MTLIPVSLGIPFVAGMLLWLAFRPVGGQGRKSPGPATWLLMFCMAAVLAAGILVVNWGWVKGQLRLA